MIRLREIWDGGPDQGSPVEGTYCEECGQQYLPGDIRKVYYVDELDETLCDRCIVKPIIEDIFDKELMDSNEKLDYLNELYEEAWEEDPVIEEVEEGIYTTSLTGDYKMTEDEVIDVLIEDISDLGPTEQQLNELFPDYTFTRVETQYE